MEKWKKMNIKKLIILKYVNYILWVNKLISYKVFKTLIIFLVFGKK